MALAPCPESQPAVHIYGFSVPRPPRPSAVGRRSSVPSGGAATICGPAGSVRAQAVPHVGRRPADVRRGSVTVGRPAAPGGQWSLPLHGAPLPALTAPGLG